MSDAGRFLNQVNSDSSLQAKLDAAGWKASAAVAIGAAAGYNFTAAELKAASSASQGELSDGALDKVSGGGILVEFAKPPKPFIFC